MPSNIIIFDAEYISELVSKMNVACELMGEAVSSLKKASMHEGWKCKECARISENIDDLNIRLGRLDEGVNETTRVLGGSVSRFAELESKYESQADGLSEDLRSNYGFSASVRPGSSGPGTGAHGRHEGPEMPRGHDGNPVERTHGAGGISGAGSAMAGRVAGAFGRGNNPNSHDDNRGFENSGSSPEIVNLPVTHIPDRPEAAAKGIKDTQAIEDAAIQSAGESIAKILGGDISIIVANPGNAAMQLANAYNAGKTVSQNSAAIISNPAMPHTQERLAMAAGLASLAGGASAGLGMMAGNSAGAKPEGRMSSKNEPEASNFRDNAKNLMPAIEGQENAGEIQSVLSSFAGEETAVKAAGVSTPSVSQVSSQNSGSSDEDSFFGKIMKSIREKINEQKNAARSAMLSSDEISAMPVPAQEFLARLI